MKTGTLGAVVLFVVLNLIIRAEETAAIPASQKEETPVVSQPAETASEWLTDYEAALRKAKAEDKPILLDFTGSDWCGWCIKLKKEVFDQPAFKKFAADNLVLVELDFPMRKPQSPSLKAQNRKLQTQFRIEGYPTIVLLDSSGKEIARTGYRSGGAEAYIKHLQELLTKNKPK